MTMKKTIIILFLAFCAISGVHAQRIMGALILGVNASQVDGDEVYGYRKFGLNAGAAAIIPIWGNWAITLENTYSEKGAHQRKRSLDSIYDGSYDLKLNYVDVPLLLQYTDKDFISIASGASWGSLVKVSEFRNGNEISTTTLNSGIYNRSDINILVDVKIRVIQRLRFNVRYAYSVRPIAHREVIDSKTGYPNMRDQYNGMFTFRLFYIFNEQLSERSRLSK